MLLSQLLETLSTYPTTQRLWVAYSGGLDSQVLLYALVQLRNESHPVSKTLGGGNLVSDLRAIHIHHGLQKSADDWLTHCQNTCEQWEIPCEVLKIHVPILPRQSTEAQAREARYAAITQLLGAEDIVVTAHHADDQAETVLLQLLRGSGVAGLAAMPSLTRLGPGWLARPLLNYTRTQLLTYAQQSHLTWIEDPSNANTRFDRNFLRHDILPKLRQHWPSLSQTLSRVARHQAEANELLDTLAIQDLAQCQAQLAFRAKFPDTFHLAPLSLSQFSQLTLARQRNVLRRWLKQQALPIPTTAQVQRILTEMITAQPDRQPLVKWSGGEVRRYRQHLFAMPNLPHFSPALRLSWRLPQPLSLPLGQLTATAQLGNGLVLPGGTELQVQFRQGGEKMQWHGHQHEVKKLLQTTQQPPWLRDFIPLIYFQNTLVAIPHLGIADPFRTSPSDIGWNLQWHLPLIPPTSTF